MGIPPTKPEKILPIPWATNSLFGDAFRLWGSMFSTASRLSKVSSEATMAMVKPTIQTWGLLMPAKFGVVIKDKTPLILGILTRCDCSI